MAVYLLLQSAFQKNNQKCFFFFFNGFTLENEKYYLRTAENLSLLKLFSIFVENSLHNHTLTFYFILWLFYFLNF